MGRMGTSRAAQRRGRAGLPDGPVSIATGTARCRQRADDPTGVLLEINGAPSSHLDLANPLRLDFEYMAWMFAVITCHIPADQRLVSVHLGGGGCALPRALDAAYRDAAQLVIEIDPILIEMVRRWFDLPRAPRLRIRPGEAGAAVAAHRPNSTNLIVRDAFDGRQIPPHLTTLGFIQNCVGLLQSGGLYLANCAGTTNLDLAKAELATAAAVFDEVAVIAEPAQLKGRRWGNCVIIGRVGKADLTANGLTRSLARLPFPARLMAGDEALTWASAARPIEAG